MIKIFSSFALIIFLSGSFFPWDYVKSNNEGVHFFQKGLFSEAEEAFRKSVEANPLSAEASYNLAITLYKKGVYQESRDLFYSILDLENVPKELQQKVNYNLGNLYYRLGQQRDQRLNWIKALSHYEVSLKIAEDPDSRKNYQYVKEKINQKVSANNQSPKGSEPQEKQKNNNRELNSTESNQRIYNITKGETDNLLNELKNNEKMLQKFIKRKKKNNDSEQNFPLKDW